MSGKLLQAVWNYEGSDLTSDQKHVLARMAWYASDAGRDIYPSIPKLCKQTGIPQSTMYRILTSLKENRFIVATGTSKLKTKIYCMNLEKLGVEDEFNEFSSISEIHPSRSGRGTPPGAGVSPLPERDPIDISNHYIERHDHHVDKKRAKKATKKPSLKQRKSALTHEENYMLEKLLRFDGIYDAVAVAIVEKHPTSEINNVIELAVKDNVESASKYIIKSLYVKGS